MKDTFDLLTDTDFPRIKRNHLETLQVNLGYLCNQQCLHCHVDASPRRKEIMTAETVSDVLNFIEHKNIKTLDLTGGAPEMNPEFFSLVRQARDIGVHVIDRCNLTVLLEPGYEDTASFLAEHRVEIVASMPCYLEENVDAQRGKGVFEQSIEGLRLLNSHGYGIDEHLSLNLVYNPQGINLPPSQHELERDYKKELKQRFDISFNNLFTITNMPIKRFGSTLISKGLFDEYMQLLKSSYSKDNLSGVMCRTTLSVDWQGNVYDCDFNQMLGLPAGLSIGHDVESSSNKHINELLDSDLRGGDIAIMDHCYGCTAGNGSSCGGALI
ncbi:MAG: arsenosugar biosynthesis radical SAM protein ArsS [Gammaproteobacteria bacterium]|nr:arsenosugar biosynthesis radical SAM protein ArsS [Gammaproteobacteria bacterium]MBT8134554.1 arsenosugar biosynthesis radical SAM protein ArsS [Gammaproteobacteria bacterium]NNJ49243.1 radical SAM/Cys-rich domain protein [Gammaproteobacteria bacterium]